METILFDKDLNELEKNIEKYSHIFLNIKENTNFVTNDGIKFKVDTILYKTIKLIFEENELKLVNILLTTLGCGYTYDKIFKIGDEHYKSIAKGRYNERKNEDYYRVSFYKQSGYKTKYFKQNGPSRIFYNEKGEIDSQTYYLFGDIVSENKYNNFMLKLKSGNIEKNINKYKRLDKIKEIYEYAKFYSLDELVNKCEIAMIAKKLSGK